LHPVNEILARLMQVIPLLLLGFKPGVVTAYVPLLTFYALLLHSNVSWSFGPLRYVIASPAFHRWHHTSQAEGQDRNFAGLFPVIDLIFGTFYMPKDRLPERFGVHGDEVPEGLLAQLIHPFRSPGREERTG
jgi:sterol desaturase/sphingolipid hydroxylase (fatty acid hydroxylase superfamily)